MNQEYIIPNNQTQIHSDGVIDRDSNISSKPENQKNIFLETLEIGQKVSNLRSDYLVKNMAERPQLIGRIASRFIKKDQKIVYRSESELKEIEREIGGSLFNESRQPNEMISFFMDNPKSWFFHREISNQKKDIISATIHYEIHETGILKISNIGGISGEFISGEELERFSNATSLYLEAVTKKIYAS